MPYPIIASSARSSLSLKAMIAVASIFVVVVNCANFLVFQFGPGRFCVSSAVMAMGYLDCAARRAA